MTRQDKNKAVARYLSAYSGIPLISWDGAVTNLGASLLESPAPYTLNVSTDAVHWRFFANVKALPDRGIPAVIRYDKYIDHLEDAVVGMRLSTFTSLLSAHYGTISDRITNTIKGD